MRILIVVCILSLIAGVSIAQSPGLNYSYYEGTWSILPNFNSITPVKTGSSPNVDLAVRNKNEYYAIKWEGYITIPATGNYIFETNSDDGSKLYLDGQANPVALVDNDGLHPNQFRSGGISLTKGVYPIVIAFFQNSSGQTMEVYWTSSNGITRERIPDNAFSSNAEPATNPAPTPVHGPAPASGESGGMTGSTNYYFSSSLGDDSRTSAQAQNPSTPWRSLSKLNAYANNLKAGDAVLFKRGEVFDGSLTITQSGNQGSPIVYSAYGSGTKPVISGFATLSGWVNAGNGIWESNCPGGTKVNSVIINGTQQVMGRYPNADAPNRGYLSFESHNGLSSITDNELPYVADWTGGEVAIRKDRWVIDRGLITGYYGNTLTYNAPSDLLPRDGFGYFIQNHPNTLDQFGEWYYDPGVKKMKVFFGSNNPNNYQVNATVVDVLVTANGTSNIEVNNLSFHGANTNAFSIGSSSDNFHISNCDILFSGMNAINANWADGFSLQNSTVNYTNNNAVYIAPYCDNAIIKNNVISNTGMIPGMAKGYNDCFEAIVIQGSNNLIQYNEILNTGYAAIKMLGEHVLIKNNFINNYCMTVDDGGGIYSSGDGHFADRQIVGNIVLNGKGVHEGTTQAEDVAANGIYMDDKTANVHIADNTVANCSENGIYIHNSHEITVINNTVYNSLRAQITLGDDILEPNDPVRNVLSTNNIFCAKDGAQLAAWFHTNLKVNSGDFGAFGSFDNNYYLRPTDDNHTIGTLHIDPQHYQYFSLEEWKPLYGKDRSSMKSPVTFPLYSNADENIRLEYNASTDNKTIPLDGTYMDVKKQLYSGSITLAPYTSALLMRQSAGTVVNSATSTTATTSTATDFDKSLSILNLQITPNPSTDKILLTFKAPESAQKAQVSIHSMLGETIQTTQVGYLENQLTVDISSWKKGVYIVSYLIDGKTHSKKFIKQ